METGLPMLDAWLTAQTYTVLLVFVRVGAALMLLPGIADSVVPGRIRLALALLLSLVVAPVVGPRLPPQPASAAGLVLLILSEAIIGIFIGTVTRLLMSALEMAGTVIAQQTGLAFAQMFNPALDTQGTLPGALLALLGGVLLFVTDLHHLLILAVVDSYTLFVPGAALPAGDFADLITRLVADGFRIGTEMAAPFLVVGLLFSIGLGLLARLMPQLPIFFVAMPAQILLGLLFLGVVGGAMMMYWLEQVQDILIRLLAP